MTPQPAPDNIPDIPDSGTDCELACTRLCIAFANLIDARAYPRLAELFTPDGCWTRPERSLRGRDAILAYLLGRPAQAITRHLCTNIQITPLTGHEATGMCYVMYFHAADEAQGLPVPTTLPLIGEYHDVYTRTGEGWRIRDRRIRVVFAP